MTSIALEAAGDTGVAGPRTTPLVARLWRDRDVLIAALALTGIIVHLTLRYVPNFWHHTIATCGSSCL
jgi:hypothetical protein